MTAGAARGPGPGSGAEALGGGRCRFSVWAPSARKVVLELGWPPQRSVALAPLGDGLYCSVVEGAGAGTLYRYRLDGGEALPDPASRRQPLGVEGPSAVVDPGAFAWTDSAWHGVRAADLVLYEIHVGTFSPEGTFDGIVPDLGRLADLGVTAIEVMPVSPFPGERNWGYDGVFPHAVQESYGGPAGLARLVDAAHAQGLGVLLDMVYNHLGPEGSVLSRYAPYFTPDRRTPWGDALAYQSPQGPHVERFFLEQAAWFVGSYHLDGLRLDAISTIADERPAPFLARLAAAVREAAARQGRTVHVIAEDDRMDPAVARPCAEGGLGIDAIWHDPLHHSVHARLTGERQGYYRPYGAMDGVVRALGGDCGPVAGGETPPGSSGDARPGWARAGRARAGRQLVAFMQNHDQVGNRSAGERLSALVPFEAAKMAAALLLLSPFTPLLFMGEEYGERAPFLYFTSHRGAALAEAVRAGRRREFAALFADTELPDPQDPATFARSRLAWPRPTGGHHAQIAGMYGELLGLRRDLAVPGAEDLGQVEVGLAGEGLVVLSAPGLVLCANFAPVPVPVPAPLPGPAQAAPWRVRFDSADARWGGPGSEAAAPSPRVQPLAALLLTAGHAAAGGRARP